jgi:hypothetical protein
MKDNIPDHRKFGYAFNREIEEIEREIAAELGVDPEKFDPRVFFGARRRYEDRHRNDPSLRRRLGKSLGAIPAKRALSGRDDLYRAALEAIRDGHNDPRTLARDTLAGITSISHGPRKPSDL